MKIINKVLFALVVLPIFMTFSTGVLSIKAYENETATEGFQVTTQELTQPVIDVNTLSSADSVDETSEEVVDEAEETLEEDTTASTSTASFTIAGAQDVATTSESAGILGVQNEDKYSKDAGEEVLEVQTPTTLENEVVTYDLTDNGELVDSEAVSEEVQVANELEVYNNKIVKADNGIVSTTGGVDAVVYAYNTLEEAVAKTNGVPFSGGAFDAEYLGTEEAAGNYYAKVAISGFEGYISLDDAQIIPSSLVKSQSHYENVNGDWMYFEATDPLTENSYLTYAVGEAPEWAAAGVNYFSYDDENYFQIGVDGQDIEVVGPGDGGNGGDGGDGGGSTSGDSYTYFQNLPLNSTASYTGSQYKSYLKHKGYTNSEYYNATDAFVEAQDKEQVNSLYLLAMADHESLYGTSEFAQKCNNFFGWGAYDSNPNNACQYTYSTPRDGILAQSLHLKQMWGDVEDSRWAGEEVGNKSHGVNVYYASDSNWGKKIAQHMYDIDKYLGSKENKYYKIYELTSTQTVYTSYSNNQKLKVTEKEGVEEDYKLSRGSGNPRVIVTGGNDDYFEFQLPTPRNNSSSTTCTFSDGNKGSYPNFNGTSSMKVTKGVASFACDYGDWTKQQAWYPRETSSGSTTYKVISGSSSKDPGSNTSGGGGSTDSASVCNDLQSTTTNSNGDKVEKWGSKEGNEKCTVTYYGKSSTRKEYIKYYYNSSNKKYKRVIYRYDSSGRKTYYANTNYSTSTGYITDYKEYYYNTKGTRIQRNEKTYASDGDPKKLVRYYYNSTPKLHNREYYTYDSSGRKEYYANTNYSTSTGDITDYKEYYYNTKGTRIQRNEKYYYSNGKPKVKYFYYYDSNGNFKSKSTVHY